jgi:hypothetical protein
VLGADETLERRRGAHIAELGCYRDAARSTARNKVKSMGLRWLSMMLIVPLPWASRSWALPFLTVSAPPEVRMRSNKAILREAMRPLLPAFALERPKQPFSTPILGWFAGPLAGRIREALAPQEAFVRRFLDGPALDALLDGRFSGRRPQVEVVFRLLTLEKWARAFGVAG